MADLNLDNVASAQFDAAARSRKLPRGFRQQMRLHQKAARSHLELGILP